MAEEQSDKTTPASDGRIHDLDDPDEVELLDLAKLESDPLSPQSAETETSAIDRLAKRRKKKEVTVDRTKLDVEACVDFAAKTKADQEERLREQLETQPPEPVKPFSPIVDFRPATPCASQWDSMTGSGRIKFCQQCKLQVYDFATTEMPEAKEMIFKQEGKENFLLFKRKDSKFLTSDCPVGVKRKQTMLVLYAVGFMLVIGCAIVVANQPPPPPPTVTVNSSSAGQDTSESEINRNVTSGQGWEVVSPKKRASKPREPMPLPDNNAIPVPSDVDSSLPQPQSLEQPAPAGPVDNPSIQSPSSSQQPVQTSTNTSTDALAPAQTAVSGQNNGASLQSGANQASSPAAEPVAPATESDNTQPSRQTGVWQRPR
jgi:hypothetical protein